MMNRIFVALVALLLLSGVLVSACVSPEGPSKADVEKFAMTHPNSGPLCRFQSVEVVQIGKPSKMNYYGEVTAWPARVNYYCGRYSELRELWMYKNAYGEWDCLINSPAG